MKKLLATILLSLALAGCAGSDTVKSSAVPQPPSHFDYNQAVTAIDLGRAALESADLERAIPSLQTGLTLWPAHQPGWSALARAYGLKGDQTGANYAAYFAERIEWANSLHGTTAASAFDNIRLIDSEKTFADRRIPQTAALLSAFYRQGQARIRGLQAAEAEARQTFAQRYMIYPVAVVSGGIVVLQLLKATGSN